LPENHGCTSRVKISPGDYWKPKVPGKKGKFPKKKSNFPEKKKSKLGIIVLLLFLLVAAVVVVPMFQEGDGETPAFSEVYDSKKECDARSGSLSNQIGGTSIYHPVLKYNICIRGICNQEGIFLSPYHYEYVETINQIKTLDDANMMESFPGRGGYYRNWELDMFALRYRYPILFEYHPEYWPIDLTDIKTGGPIADPLGCPI